MDNESTQPIEYKSIIEQDPSPLLKKIEDQEKLIRDLQTQYWTLQAQVNTAHQMLDVLGVPDTHKNSQLAIYQRVGLLPYFTKGAN
jgi:hypothetical protein